MFIALLKDKLWFWKVKYEVSPGDRNTLFERTDTKLWLWANYVVVFFILLSIVVVWIDTIPEFSKAFMVEIFLVDFLISTVFLVEYIYRWKRSSSKTVFPFRLMNILDILSFAPFFILILIYGVGSYSIFALFRIFRVFRIFELIERLPIVTKLLRWINRHKVEYLAAVFVILIILTVFSTLVYLVEQAWWNAVAFSSMPETFWWAIVTMTTTWYGNMIPVSLAWKVIASFLMILWPILIAILSSITVIIFIDSTKIINLDRKNKKCEECHTENEIDAKYCKKCGAQI